MKKYIKPEIRQIDLELNCVLYNGSASTQSVDRNESVFLFSDSNEPAKE